ncbi:MAG TPA: hypothetical protein PLK63_04620 [Catalimonadaceae bacterium]|nr:hypothetical protein [Catalimonadaceae bacterium]
MRNRKSGLLLSVMMFLMVSCATYHTTVDRLAASFQYVGEGSHVALTTGMAYHAPGNNLNRIKVLDKEGYETELIVTFQTSICITKKDGSKTSFLLSTMMLKDSIITGNRSNMVGLPIKPIHLRDVEKIEFKKN